MTLYELAEIELDPPIIYVRDKEGKSLCKCSNKRIQKLGVPDAEIIKIGSSCLGFFVIIDKGNYKKMRIPYDKK